MWENSGFIVGTGMIRLEVRNAVVVSPKTVEFAPVPFEDIATLVDELGLPEEAAARLSLSACALTQWYIMPKALMQSKEDRATSRKRLTKIAKLSAALKAELAALGPLAAVTLTEAGQDLPREHDQRISLVGLQRQLEQLSKAADATLETLPALDRGRREDKVAEMVMRQLVRITEKATGEPVLPSKSKNSIYEPRLLGRGGKFITAWFKRVDRQISPKTLYTQAEKARKKLEQPGVAEEDAKWLEVCELALLSPVTPTR